MGGAIQGGIDGVENAVEIVAQLGVPESEGTVAFALQPAGSNIVPGRHIITAMVPTIEFDEEPRLQVTEVRHVLPNRNLSAKMAPVNGNAFERTPQPLLRVGRRRAKAPGRGAPEVVETCQDSIPSRSHPTPALRADPPPQGEGLGDFTPPHRRLRFSATPRRRPSRVRARAGCSSGVR